MLTTALVPLALAAAVAASSPNAARQPEQTVGVTVFVTEPYFVIEVFDVEVLTEESSLLAPGYLFIDPIAKGIGSGPQIYAQDGTLIWYGGGVDDLRVQDFHACDYLGHKGEHLCYSEMLSDNDINNRNPANKVIRDSSYNVVMRSNVAIGDAQPNLHEFNLVDDGYSYVQPVYPAEVIDMRPFAGQEDGYMWDGCFQEVDVASLMPNYQWCFRDHYPVWETNIWPEIPGQTNVTSNKAGMGVWDNPFDPYHVNAIDKNDEGDYLVSSRHTDSILKIAGLDNIHGVKPGTVLWHLGGQSNQFEFEGEPVTFSKQHHVRFLHTGQNETTFSFLDNAWDGSSPASASVSSGLVVAVNNATMTARVLHRYPNPDKVLAGSQASMQVLPNGNAFVGWGELPQFSEFANDGTVLFHAVWKSNMGRKKEHSYRAFKAPWAGRPLDPPKLVAYSRSCTTSPDSPLIAWVSWNGATDVASYAFFVSTSATGPWFPLGHYPKDGFETHVTLLEKALPRWLTSVAVTRAPYVSVEARDAAGRVLGSTVAATFVPAANISDNCDAQGCYAPADRFAYDTALGRGAECGRSLLPQVLAGIVLFFVLEYLDWAYLWAIAAAVLPARSWLDGRTVFDAEAGDGGEAIFLHDKPRHAQPGLGLGLRGGAAGASHAGASHAAAVLDAAFASRASSVDISRGSGTAHGTANGTANGSPGTPHTPHTPHTASGTASGAASGTASPAASWKPGHRPRPSYARAATPT